MAEPSQEQIQALADAVSTWRMQEYIYISSYAFYAYYILTTMREEVSIIYPQRWNGGKMLYLVIRYAMVAFIAVVLLRDYRSYFTISPMACKILLIVFSLLRRLVSLSTDTCLALCLSALLRLKRRFSILIMALCTAPTVTAVVFKLMADIQYPAEPTTPLDLELGYPCYYVSSEDWSGTAVMHSSRHILGYINITLSALLALLGVFTLVTQYKGRNGRLIQVIQRDGGALYISLIVLRLSFAVVYTPDIIDTLEGALETSAPYTFMLAFADAIATPILSQRLLVNMRKVDYMGSQPFASKLLFAPPAPGSEDESSEEGYFDDSEQNRY